MTTVDLSRIPEVYRERVEREMRQAAAAAFGASRLAGDPPWRQTEAHDHDAAAVLARYLKIAAEAEGAAARQYTMTCAGGGYTPGDQIPETMRLVCEGSANAARAKVWADELAKLDAPAEPPPGYWSTGIAVERKATPVPRAFPVRFTSEDDAARLYGVLLGVQINFPRAIGVLGDRLEPILEALRGPAAPEVEEVSPDLAADAAQAVRAAQRAHLDATAGAWTVGPLGPPQFTITGPDALRLVLDAVVRYLAGKAPETLAALVELLKTLPLGYAPKIDLGGCDEGAAALAVVAALPGAYTGATARENGTPLYYAHAEVNGVEVTARHAPTPPRPTIAGAAGLDMAARAGGDR